MNNQRDRTVAWGKKQTLHVRHTHGLEHQYRRTQKPMIYYFFHAQLIMKFFLLINVKTPIVVGILTFTSGINTILGFSEPKKSQTSWYFIHMTIQNFMLKWDEHIKKFYNLGPRIHDAWMQRIFQKKDRVNEKFKYAFFQMPNNAWRSKIRKKIFIAWLDKSTVSEEPYGKKRKPVWTERKRWLISVFAVCTACKTRFFLKKNANLNELACLRDIQSK